MARSENLTIMFVDMVGFTERTAQQSRAQNEALLHDFHRLLLPVVSGFGGRLIKSIGDALLVVFHSPTDGVRCGMGLHDAVAEHNGQSPYAERIHIRVAINVGEVRVEYGDIFGEAVNVAARLEALTPQDELYLTEAVYLAMNKAEVSAESLGKHRLKGIPEPVRLFRVPPRQISRLVAGGEDLGVVHGELPYGGLHRFASGRSLRVTLRHLWNRTRTVDWMVRARQLPWGAIGVTALCILIAGLAYWRGPELATPQAAAEASAEPAVDPVAEEERRLAALLLQQGDQAWREGRRRDAIGMYAQALKLHAPLRDDPQIAARLVASLGRSSDIASPVILMYPTQVVLDQLAERTAGAGPIGRHRAADLLQALGKDALIDRTGLVLADLREAEQCAERRELVLKLRELKDPRALPALRDTLEGGLRSWLQNACLRDVAEATIAEIRRVQRASAAKAAQAAEAGKAAQAANGDKTAQGPELP